MKLQDIKGAYDVIVSIGNACNPAMELKRLGLRSFSGPLDWSVSSSLLNVSKLFEHRFRGFMEHSNMRLMDEIGGYIEDGEDQFKKAYFLKDEIYDVLSVHDFPVNIQNDWTLSYESFKEKKERRVERYLHKIHTGNKVLLVRWFGDYEGAVELEKVLKGFVTGDFRVLLLYPVNGLTEIREVDWGLDHVCVVEVPNEPTNQRIWDYVLSGITLVE